MFQVTVQRYPDNSIIQSFEAKNLPFVHEEAFPTFLRALQFAKQMMKHYKDVATTIEQVR